MSIIRSWSNDKYYIVNNEKYLSFQYPEKNSYVRGPFETQIQAETAFQDMFREAWRASNFFHIVNDGSGLSNSFFSTS